MKIVKLTQRHTMGQYGFTHALRFPRENKDSDAIKRALHQMHGNVQPWNKWWGWQNPQSPWGYYSQSRRDRPAYWIGVKNEADLTVAILVAEINDV